MRYSFRFDDVSVNTDANKLWKMVEFIRRRLEGEASPIRTCEITFAVSLGVFDMKQEVGLRAERVFPSVLHTESDFRCFYNLDKIGIPALLNEAAPNGILVASHGIVHVDHRLLSKKAQELSILLSCSLLKTSIFVPPFHKWNDKTEEVCRENLIDLVKFENLRHLGYHKFDAANPDYYLHTHDFTYDQFVARFS